MNENNTNTTGFSLVELIFTVAIASILSALVLPVYQDYIFRARRAEARVALMELLQAEERYATQYNCYLAFNNIAGVATVVSPMPVGICPDITAKVVPFKTFSGDSPMSSHYLLSASRCDAAVLGNATTPSIQECVMAQATPKLADSAVGIIYITSAGQKKCQGSDENKCWK